MEWQSNSSLGNYSGKSEPEFTIDPNSGDLVILEYFYKNNPLIPPMQLWSMETNVDADDSGRATEWKGDIIGIIVFVVLCGFGYYGYKRWNASKAVVRSHSNHLAEQQR